MKERVSDKQPIKLLKAHRHEGEDFATGDVIGARPVVAKWLIDNGIGEFSKPVAVVKQPLQGNSKKTSKEKQHE